MFGELASQPSRLSPDGVMDPAVGQLVAAGLASAATLLTASLLRSAYKRAPGTARLRGPFTGHTQATPVMGLQGPGY